MVFRPLQRLNTDQIVSMLQRRTRTAPTTRFGALLAPLVPIYNRSVAHLGPQERPKILLERPVGRLGPFENVLGAVLCPSFTKKRRFVSMLHESFTKKRRFVSMFHE